MQHYQAVTRNDIEAIHDTSLRILNEVGVVFGQDRARDILAKGGAKIDGQTVRFPREMIKRALETVPSSFRLRGREEAFDVEINTRDAIFASQDGPPFVHDADNGRRVGTMEDFKNLAKLCHMMDSISILSFILCEPADVDPRVRDLELLYNKIKYSSKPQMGPTLGYEVVKEGLEMAALVFGGAEAMRENPALIGILCTLSPLCIDDKSCGGIIAYAEYGQPQLISSLCMAGATAPTTLPGAIAVQNAEILAGIALAQTVNPGTPIVYSASGSSTDMRLGSLAVGAPEGALFSLINGQLAKYYNIPCRIGGAISDSKCVDAQAGYESMMAMLMAQMAGGNFILHGGGIMETYNCVSFDKMMVDHEIVGLIKRIGRGVEVNARTLAFDLIREVGPQGAYINQAHTFKNFRQEFYQPEISDRNNYDQWVKKGSLRAEERANARWKNLLAEYQEPQLPAEVDRDLRKYIDSRK